MHFIAGLGSLD